MNRDVLPVIFGTLVSTTLAGTLVIAGLKAGITPGVSPLVILIAWGIFARRAATAGGTRFLNLAQVSGSAGMAVTAGVIFTAPLVQILYASKGLEVPSVQVGPLILLSFSGAFIGFGFVGLAVAKFLSDPTLPAPEARACKTMIDAAVVEKSSRPAMGRSLYLGALAGLFAPLLAHIGLVLGQLTLFSRSQEDGSRSASIGLPFAPIYIGIGGLLTLSTALLVFGGSFIRLIGDWVLAGIPDVGDAGLRYPANSMRWVGGGAMTVAVAYSLFKFSKMRLPTAGSTGDVPATGLRENVSGRIPAAEEEPAPPSRETDPSLITVDARQRRWQVMSIGLGGLLLLGYLVTSGADPVFVATMAITIVIMAMLMVTLGAILSLQIGSSASPVSGTIFVTTLVLCLAALATRNNRIEDVLFLTPLLVAACVAVCTANDSSQDYKTLQLCGVRVQDGFLAQILGLMGGAIVVPIVLYVAHEAYTLGSPDLAAPQGQMFATLIDGLLLQSQLPWYPIGVGVALGLGAVLLDFFAGRKGMQLPSMALAVGIYLPAAIGIGIVIGALARKIGEGKLHRPRNETILAAAGLITGAAALDLILGVLIIAVTGFTPENLLLFGPAGTEGVVGIPGVLPAVLCGLGILSLAGILWRNARG